MSKKRKKNKNRDFSNHFSWDLTLKFSLISIVSFFLPLPIIGATGILLYYFKVVPWLTPHLMVIITLATCFFIGCIISVYLTKRQTAQTNEMVQTMKKVANGDYSAKMEVPEKSDAIYYPIAVNFNHMVDELNSTAILQTDFASNFSHEFKTPIQSIRGYAQILQSVPDLSEEQKKRYLQIIIDESKRLTELASSTLLMSKLDAVESLENKKVIRVNEQIEEAVLLLDKQLKDKDIHIYLDLKPVSVLSNEEMLKEVWINLLTNDIKYNKESGNIYIKSWEEKDSVIVTFTDTGIGMDEETVGRIFERYYQNESSRISKGNGLGLSIAKRITELSGGKIEVKSIPHQGTIFTLTFPAVEIPPITHEEKAEEEQ